MRQEPLGDPPMRMFATGATRDTDARKLDFEAFLAPSVLERYAVYMDKARRQSDGSLRDGDNWQRGIPREVYIKSAWRHFFAAWRGFRRGDNIEEELCATLFNTMGLLFEELKRNDTHANLIARTIALPRENGAGIATLEIK